MLFLSYGIPVSADFGGAYAAKQAPLRAKGKSASAGRAGAMVKFKWYAEKQELDFQVTRRNALLDKALGISRRSKRGQVAPLLSETKGDN